MSVGGAVARSHPRQIADEALVDRARTIEETLPDLTRTLQPLLDRRERFGIGRVGHGDLVIKADLVDVERALEVEDRPPVLDGDDPARRERTAVADPVNFVEDRVQGVAGPEEVAVQGMHAATLDGPPRRHERLGCDLAPEDALTGLIEVRTTECVHLDDLEIEQRDKVGEGFGHVADDRLSSCRP
jgi:hypothetical protein